MDATSQLDKIQQAHANLEEALELFFDLGSSQQWRCILFGVERMIWFCRSNRGVREEDHDD